MITNATFSPCRRYRYLLSRTWDVELPTCIFIGLNPSTADETTDDPTIRKCIHFARQWGFGELKMVNLFAFRATSPTDMMREPEPIGAENDKWLQTAAFMAGRIVAAWGNQGNHLARAAYVARLLPPRLVCFRVTKAGQPEHPLYVRYDRSLIEFAPHSPSSSPRP